MLNGQVKEDLKNPWLRSIIGVVAITLLVNFGFIGYAFLFPPNLVVKDYYERGKNYFHDAQLRQQQAPTAWRLQLMVPDHIVQQQPTTVRLYVMDHAGIPLRSGRVRLTAYRPSDAEQDFSVNLKQSDVGTFAATIRFPLLGHWDLIARIDAGEHHFDTAQRIFVQR